jgi:Tfp pilus assembly protein PilV
VTSRRAYTFMEIVIAVSVLSLAVLGMYSLFLSSARTVTNSRLQYMSQLVAREIFEELRITPMASWTSTPATEWRSLEGKGLFEALGALRPGPSTPTAGTTQTAVAAVNTAAPRYPAEYGRFKYRITFSDTQPAHPRLKKVTVIVKWQEFGGREGAEKTREGIISFSSILANHSTDPEVF